MTTKTLKYRDRKHITIRLSPEEHERVSKWASQFYVNRSVILRTVLLNHVAIAEGTAPTEWFELDKHGRTSWQ